MKCKHNLFEYEIGNSPKHDCAIYMYAVVEGFVVANDMDNKRCYLMTHQVKRIQSPNCMIINHDARVLPNMSLSANEVRMFEYYHTITIQGFI